MKNQLLIIFLTVTIHLFAQVKPVAFSQKTLEPVNEIIKNRFVGNGSSFVINEYAALYSTTSQYMVYSNFKTGKTGSVRLNDSLLYALVFNKEQVAEIEEKMVKYKKEIEEYSLKSAGNVKHGESHLNAFCFYGNRIYIMYYVMNFYGMKTLQSATKQETDGFSFYHEDYLVELFVNDSSLSKGRTWNLKNESTKSVIPHKFSIVEDQPAMYFKTTIDKKDHYEYILLNKTWEKKMSEQAFPSMMSGIHNENNFYNAYVLNYEQHILINNQTREKLKILPGSTRLAPVYSGHFIPYKNLVYARVFKKTEKTHSVLKVDVKTKSNTEVKTFKDHDLYPFPPLFYIDQTSNTLYILDINDAKQLVIVDFIKL